MRAVALLLAACLLAGCTTGPTPDQDAGEGATCRQGEGAFFLVVRANKDFFSTAEELAKDRFHTVGHDRLMFGFMGTPQPGSGRVLGSDGNFIGVTREEVQRRLVAVGLWSAETDFVVHEAWQARLDGVAFGKLCDVIVEEGDPNYPTGGERMGCADGGTRVYDVETGTGSWNRTVGCMSDASVEEYESGSRIEIAFSKAITAARSSLGLDG